MKFLGLIFLKYVSDAFEALYEKLAKGEGEYEGADPEDPNEYIAEKVFFVPLIARWERISDNAKKAEILLSSPPLILGKNQRFLNLSTVSPDRISGDLHEYHVFVRESCRSRHNRSMPQGKVRLCR